MNVVRVRSGRTSKFAPDEAATNSINTQGDRLSSHAASAPKVPEEVALAGRRLSEDAVVGREQRRLRSFPRELGNDACPPDPAHGVPTFRVVEQFIDETRETFDVV